MLSVWRISLVITLLAILVGEALVIWQIVRGDFLFRSKSALEFQPQDATSPKPKIFLPLWEEKKAQLLAEKSDFLEVNLEAMTITLWRKGEHAKQISILAKGDPQSWGGSAVGLYKIMSGAKVSYSGAAEVYMPYALRYYGKYYLHGEPYYRIGQKLISSVSGGCLRQADQDAQEIYELVDIDLPVLVIDKVREIYDYGVAEPQGAPEISARSYLVADLDSGMVFAEKQASEQLPIASITKLMTAIVVAENIDLRRTITAKESMLEKGFGSTKGLEVGRRYRIVELFYPLLTESSNDAAEVLAGFLGRERTIKMMNEKAKAIMMPNTIFTDPSGFDPNNLSTSRDLFYLIRYLVNSRPPILKITKSETEGVSTFGPVKFSLASLYNKNVFLLDSTFLGGKTGFIKTSQYTGVFAFKLTTPEGGERNVVFVLLGSDDLKSDTQKLYKWLQENYFNTSVVYSSQTTV